MPLLDHFHPPLHPFRHWEGFHHAWAHTIVQQLNSELPPDYFAESEITLGPEFEIDVATMERISSKAPQGNGGTAVWTPPRPRINARVDFSQLDTCEIRVYYDPGDVKLCGAIELISPGNKDRADARRTFAAKCAGYIRHGVSLTIVDIVTSRKGNLHQEMFKLMELNGRGAMWKSATGLYAVAYRTVPVRKNPRLEVWPETLKLGKKLPVLPLWLALDLYVPVRLEETYLAACQSLRIAV